MQKISITIINWHKYQTVSERVRYPYWFRFHRDACHGPGLSGLKPEQKWLWIVLLSECCKKKSDQISLDIDWLCNVSGLSKNAIFQAIDILEINGTITANSRPTHGELTANSTHIIEEEIREETTFAAKQSKIASSPAEFVISDELMKSWVLSYKDETWINHEVSKARSWLIANPNKAPKTQFKRFFNGWLSRGWESHRQKIKNQSKGSCGDIGRVVKGF